MLKRWRLMGGLLLGDMLLTGLALWLSSLLRPLTKWGAPLTPLEAQIPWPVYGIALLTWGIVFVLSSVYRPEHQLRAADELQAVTLAVITSALVFAGALYFSFRLVSRLQVLMFAVLDLGLLLGFHLAVRLASRWPDLYGRHYRRHVLVVGAGPVGREAAAMIQDCAWAGLHMVGFLDDDPQADSDSWPVLGSVDDACRVVDEHNVDEVIIALPLRAHAMLANLVTRLQDMSVNVRMVPDFYDLVFLRSRVEDFGGMPLITLREPALDSFQRLTKRVFDLVVGSALLLFNLPLMGLIALSIKFDSPGPVIFKQQRVGEKGRLFDMLKFRSMVADAEARRAEVYTYTPEGQVIHKRPGDPRVTRVGRWLRRFSLDELPQLVNVLKGEMSLVGPRPELPWLVERYEPWQRKRFEVPQGITGWWQVNGRSDKPLHLHTEEDLYYIKHYSLLLDVQILWKTLAAVAKRKGAY
jgi:exopolysaccharide biosynthesis polyprenyl glycosylphosphotransferase